MKESVELSIYLDDASQVGLLARIIKKVSNPYDLWIAVQGFDESATLTGVTYAGINTWQGDNASIVVPKPQGVTFAAFVWNFYRQNIPVSNIVNPT